MIAFIIESILLGVGLAMDASAVSMTNGMKYKNINIKKIFLIAFMFGFFQALMPFIGYLLGSQFTSFLGKFTPYIALILLGYVGGKMLYDGVKNNQNKDDLNNIEKENDNLKYKTLFVQAIATAIDALSVGIVMINYKFSELLISITIIAIVTFILSFISVFLGKKFGILLNDKAEILGGIILISIGLEIFISGVFF